MIDEHHIVVRYAEGRQQAVRAVLAVRPLAAQKSGCGASFASITASCGAGGRAYDAASLALRTFLAGHTVRGAVRGAGGITRVGSVT